MDKNLKRAVRRHHLRRLKKKRINYYSGFVRALPEADRLRFIGRYAHSASMCSCWMCGNPRRHLGEVSLQEALAAAVCRRDRSIR